MAVELYASRSTSLSRVLSSAIVVVLILGCFLRITSTNFERAISPGDETTYINAAHSLLTRGYFIWDPYSRITNGDIPPKPTTALAPGFPLYLAALFSTVGENVKLLIIFNLAFNICTLLLLSAIVLKLNMNTGVKLIVIGLISLYPGFIYNIDRLLTEQLFLLLFVTFFYCFIEGLNKQKIFWFVFAGISIGYAAQIRAFGLPFVLLAVVMTIVFRRNNFRLAFKQAAAMATPVLAMMTVYWSYSWHTFHHVYWLPEGSYGAQIWGSMPYFIDMSYANNRNLQQLLSINIETMPTVFWKWRIFGFFQYMWGDIWDENLTHPFWYLRYLLWFQLLLVIPTLIAIPYAIRRHQPEVMLIACVPIAFTLMNIPFHGLPRYVWPSIPFAFITLGFIIDRACGCLVPAFPFKDERSRSFSTLMHYTLFAISIPFAIILAYSVFIFAWGIGEQMSEVRLARNVHSSIAEVEKLSPTSTEVVTIDDVSIENVSKIDEGIYSGTDDGQPIIKFLNDLPLLDGNRNIVTKLTIRSRGGHLNDFMTVYWTGKKTPEISEEAVYGRFPTNSLQGQHVVYIDDDIKNVLIVPAGFKGSHFQFENIQVDKFVLDRAVN